jgi:hypothetical protein
VKKVSENFAIFCLLLHDRPGGEQSQGFHPPTPVAGAVLPLGVAVVVRLADTFVVVRVDEQRPITTMRPLVMYDGGSYHQALDKAALAQRLAR